MQRRVLESSTVILALFVFCVVSVAPLIGVAANNTAQDYDGIVVAAVGGSEDVVQTAHAISSFDFAVKDPVTVIGVSSSQGVQTILQNARGYLVIVGHGSYYGIETNQGAVPWATIRAFIQNSPARVIIVVSCYSALLGTFYGGTKVYGFNGPLDVEVAQLAACGILLTELGNYARAGEVANQLFEPNILSKAFHPEKTLEYSIIGSDLQYGYNNHLKAYLELRKQTESDPSWDYYLAVLRLQDMTWQNVNYIGPWDVQVDIYFYKYYSGSGIIDHSPTAGTNTLVQTSLTVFGFSLTLPLPGGSTNYSEQITSWIYAKWHQYGSSILWPWTSPWVFKDKCDFAIEFRVPQGTHGTVYGNPRVYWYILIPGPFYLWYYGVLYGEDYTLCQVGY